MNGRSGDAGPSLRRGRGRPGRYLPGGDTREHDVRHIPLLAVTSAGPGSSPVWGQHDEGTGPMHNRRPRRRPGRGLPKAARRVPGPGRFSPLPGRWWRQACADRWSFLFGEIALSTFVVLAATGVYLALFFDPAMTRAAYHGSYGRLRGMPVSRAYESTLHLSFDVRGGLLIRQIHHWAALIFVAAVCLLLLRLFFTGAFRRPRSLTWLIWVIMLILGMAAGWTGTILPDDLLSGGSLGLLQGVVQSIPVVGTHLTLWIFGDGIPGHQIIPRIYWLHVLVVPVAMAGLLILQRGLSRRHGHASLPGPAGSSRSRAFQDTPAAVSVATFFATCGGLTLLGALAQVNPIWLLGPYRPGAITAGAVPDWYMGFLDGALRIMPAWEFEVAGHPVTLGVL